MRCPLAANRSATGSSASIGRTGDRASLAQARIESRRQGARRSSFDDFLREDGLHEEVTAWALKRVIARQLDGLMRENRWIRTAPARRMQASRTQLDRLLDPENDSVTHGTLTRAAHTLEMELV
jgi:hypothetical protein